MKYFSFFRLKLRNTHIWKNTRLMKINTTLALLCIIILLIEIGIGVWYWNELKPFNSSDFNNVVTPSLSFVAIIIYAWALANTIRQNKIILSQSIKPYYEKEIENKVSEAKKILIDVDVLNLERHEKVNPLNYIRIITTTIASLSQNKDFVEDYKKSESHKPLNKNSFKEKSYYKEVLFLTKFTLNIHEVYFFYEDIKSLIQEINDSKLIDEEKLLLKKKIKRALLSEYLAFIDYEDKNPLLAIKIPNIYGFQDEVEYLHISKTAFRQHYDYFKSEL